MSEAATMRQTTQLDRARLWFWSSLVGVLTTAWLWRHGGWDWAHRDFTRPNLFGRIWTCVMANWYYAEELCAGRIPEETP